MRIKHPASHPSNLLPPCVDMGNLLEAFAGGAFCLVTAGMPRSPFAPGGSLMPPGNPSLAVLQLLGIALQ